MWIVSEIVHNLRIMNYGNEVVTNYYDLIFMTHRTWKEYK